ncbi:MAG: hypothetical protein GXP08_12950 [Gammaproteobacteria bacterium]|nr:hypothetical protein [Gammaproteobacteria bacterium]
MNQTSSVERLLSCTTPFKQLKHYIPVAFTNVTPRMSMLQHIEHIFIASGVVANRYSGSLSRLASHGNLS